MKKQTKGIILTIFFGGGLLFWATAATLPGMEPSDSEGEVTITNTPMDNYPDAQRTQFCGSEESAKSTFYIQEYKIPTPCTQPLAIVSDPDGNLWFTQTNTGKVAKFDPQNEEFTEYENPIWESLEQRAGGGIRSMMWGIDYSPDGSLWFTDEATDGIWRFSILDEEYSRTDYPRTVDSLPQRLSIEGSNIIVNDFLGNKLTFLDPTQSTEGLASLSIPSPVENSVTAAFAIDSQKNVWYTNWIFQTGGVLAKFSQEKLEATGLSMKENSTAQIFDLIDIYSFPTGMTTPNGIAVQPNDMIWIADTSSSYFFRFDPNTESFTKYITSTPSLSAYGNSSGLIKDPVSRPYWAKFTDDGLLVFNEQTANRIGVFDPKDESLTEYVIPSTNPLWADCEQLEDCGLAQAFDFTILDDKIWFTEWVENNVGVIDTSLPLHFDVELDKQKITLSKGQQEQLTFSVIPTGDVSNVSLSSSTTASFSDLTIQHNAPETFNLESDSPKTFEVTLTASENALPDIYKVLISAQTDELVVSQFVTVIIEQ